MRQCVYNRILYDFCVGSCSVYIPRLDRWKVNETEDCLLKKKITQFWFLEIYIMLNFICNQQINVSINTLHSVYCFCHTLKCQIFLNGHSTMKDQAITIGTFTGTCLKWLRIRNLQWKQACWLFLASVAFVCIPSTGLYLVSLRAEISLTVLSCLAEAWLTDVGPTYFSMDGEDAHNGVRNETSFGSSVIKYSNEL